MPPIASDTVIEEIINKQPNVSFFILATFLKKYFPERLGELVELYKSGNDSSILQFYKNLNTLDPKELKHRRYFINSINRWRSRGIELVDKSLAKILLPFAEHVYDLA